MPLTFVGGGGKRIQIPAETTTEDDPTFTRGAHKTAKSTNGGIGYYNLVPDPAVIPDNVKNVVIRQANHHPIEAVSAGGATANARQAAEEAALEAGDPSMTVTSAKLKSKEPSVKKTSAIPKKDVT